MNSPVPFPSKSFLLWKKLESHAGTFRCKAEDIKDACVCSPVLHTQEDGALRHWSDQLGRKRCQKLPRMIAEAVQEWGNGGLKSVVKMSEEGEQGKTRWQRISNDRQEAIYLFFWVFWVATSISGPVGIDNTVVNGTDKILAILELMFYGV